jgi:hypothetical protein
VNGAAPAAADVIAHPTELSASIVPNPLGVGGTLRFTVTRLGPVSAGIYDVQGRLARRLLQAGALEPGEYSAPFDRRRDDGTPLRSGLYFYRVVTAGGTITGRCIVMN